MAGVPFFGSWHLIFLNGSFHFTFCWRKLCHLWGSMVLSHNTSWPTSDRQMWPGPANSWPYPGGFGRWAKTPGLPRKADGCRSDTWEVKMTSNLGSNNLELLTLSQRLILEGCQNHGLHSGSGVTDSFLWPVNADNAAQRPTAVVTSPSLRCLQTAWIVAKTLQAINSRI